MKAFVALLVGVILALALVSIAFVVYIRAGDYLNKLDQKHQLDTDTAFNDAIDGCFRDSVITTTSKDGVISEPSMYNYHLCLSDKGVVVPSANR